VALTPRCAAELGYEIAADEAKKTYVEVSGRKGHGVKADDLISRMLRAAEERVRQKHPQMAEPELKHTANALAVGALRFFLLKFTRNTIIAFDFDDALSAEGETGPYCQYAVVRIRGIRRKGLVGEDAAAAEQEQLARTGVSALTLPDVPVSQYLSAAEDSDIWALVVQAGLLHQAVDAGIRAQEPAFVAKYAFELAQGFNVFYHKHHILSETDEQKRVFLLALTELVERQMVRALQVLGIEAPEKM